MLPTVFVAAGVDADCCGSPICAAVGSSCIIGNSGRGFFPPSHSGFSLSRKVVCITHTLFSPSFTAGRGTVPEGMAGGRPGAVSKCPVAFRHFLRPVSEALVSLVVIPCIALEPLSGLLYKMVITGMLLPRRFFYFSNVKE